ncbi:hypothetical protein HMPREF9545_00156 [Escherichia coli MS 16-3]|nr:hypothetical protein HMPREF9545_00156 [Escherichia coli MS 16-3]ESC95529.1 hypothetical protein HMPREF1593_03275 [Escherichia coli 907391]ESD36509.1 hypothetical protein HMPREF1604_03965 [Escherichia coli 908519]KXG93142.1 hypothetical protein HMPREF3041_03309 [Escherichia coli]
MLTVGRIRRSRRIRQSAPDVTLTRLIRQFSAPDEGNKCRVAWNY